MTSCSMEKFRTFLFFTFVASISIMIFHCSENSIVDMEIKVRGKEILVDDTYYNVQPFWHPDNNHIFYVALAAKDQPYGSLKQVNVDGTTQEDIIDLNMPVKFPDVSSDGEKIIACINPNSTESLVIYNLKNRDKMIISNDFQNLRMPRWSHDGKSIAFIRDDAFAVMNVSDKKIKYYDLPVKVHSFSWGARDDQVILSGERENAFVLFEYNLTNSQISLLFNEEIAGIYPSMSLVKGEPFATLGMPVAYQFQNNIMSIANHKDPVLIATDAETPDWSFDGIKISYSRDGKIIIEEIFVPIDG